ncbi:MAG: CRTAC1 family protein [Planctomycetota bacterium]
MNPMAEAEKAFEAFRDGKTDSAIEQLHQLYARSQDPKVGRALAGIMNERGLRTPANGLLRQVMVHQTMSVSELNALVFPLNPFGDFKSKPNVDDAPWVRARGPLSVAAALQSRGDTSSAITALGHARSKLERPAVLARLAWLHALRREIPTAKQALGELEALPKSFLSDFRADPVYWMAQGELADHVDAPESAWYFAQALLREPATLPALDSLIASLQRQESLSGELRRLKVHRQKIRETVTIVRKLNQSNAPSEPIMKALAGLLGEVGRPLEAAGWQELRLRALTPDHPSLRSLGAYKRSANEKLPLGFDPKLAVGGIDVDRFAKPRTLGQDPRQLLSKTPASGRRRTAGETQIPVFRNVATEMELRWAYRNARPTRAKHFRLFEALGGGLAVIDFDCDGEADLFAGQADQTKAAGDADGDSDAEPDALFRQRGNRFENVSQSAGIDSRGYALGVSAGDLNQDGFDDLLVANHGVNHYWINQGDGTFAALADRIGEDAMTISIAVADIIPGGAPEIVEVNYVDDPRVDHPIRIGTDGTPVSLPGPLHFAPGTDSIVMQNARGTWTRQHFPQAATGMGVLVADLDDQPGCEIFVANDQLPNQLWKLLPMEDSPSGSSMSESRLSASTSSVVRLSESTSSVARLSESKLQWVDTAALSGVDLAAGGKAMACMGVVAADFLGQGKIGLHVTNYSDQSSHLFVQRRRGQFYDAAAQLNLDQLSTAVLGFGTQALDYDHNGQCDLVVANGHVEDLTQQTGVPFLMPPQLLTFDGKRFVELNVVDPQVSTEDAFWKRPRLGRAIARMDLDADGDEDLAWSDLQLPLAILRNDTDSAHHFVQLVLIGTQSSRHPVGARVDVVHGGGESVAFVTAGDGYASRNETLLTIGLGSSDQIDSLRVRWPGGQTQSFALPNVDSRYLLIEGQRDAWPVFLRDKP